MILFTADSELPNRTLSQGRALIRALSEHSGTGTACHAVGDPQTASVLLVLKGTLRSAGTYGMIPSTGGSMTNYTGYAEDLSYELWDAAGGGMIAAGTVKGPSNLSNAMISASSRNDANQTFWVECGAQIANASEGAEELGAALERQAEEYCRFGEQAAG